MKYYKEGTETLDCQVYYKILGPRRSVIADYSGGTACFSAITYVTLDKDTRLIAIQHPIKNIPYDWEVVRRWIGELKEIGFPCACIRHGDTGFFYLLPAKFTWKMHLISTLMLVRACYEFGICHVPEKYFAILDENPKADKFDALQTAHKQVMGNDNHMVTCSYNGTNITKETLFKRYEETGMKVFDCYRHVTHEALWRGDTVNKQNRDEWL